MVGCSSPPQPPPKPKPPAEPKVLSQELSSAPLKAVNDMLVTVRNFGAEGMVHIQIDAYGYQYVPLRESGLEKAFRETFTREYAPAPQSRYEEWLVKSWAHKVRMKAGEQQQVTVPLPGHSTWDSQRLRVWAKGCWE
jgi:hypothetical protein